MSLALFFLRKLLKVLCCLKQLLAGLVDRDLLDNGPDFLRLPAILGSFLKAIDRHAGLLHAQWRHQPDPFNLD